MKVPQYASLIALLEHYRALRSSPNHPPEEHGLIREIETLIDCIGPETRPLIEAQPADEPSDQRRRRERAERRLGRELLSRGILTR